MSARATKLSEALTEYGSQAYLLTIADDGPHASHVNVSLDGNRLCFSVGRSARRNVATNPQVSLLWPAPTPDDYSIVVNGVMFMDSGSDERATVTVTKSVFHRPGPSRSPGGACTSDCVPLTIDS